MAFEQPSEPHRELHTHRETALNSTAFNGHPVLDAQYGKHIISYDWEAYSEADIKEVGALNYAMHPSTVPLLVCYTVDGGPVQHYRPGSGEPIPEVFFTAANDPNWCVAKHNNMFDSALEIYQAGPRFGWPLVPIERQICTMALAQYHNFPGSLEKIADRLALSLRKDKVGKKLMLRVTRPQRRPDGSWGYIEPTPEEWDDLIKYCNIDAGLIPALLHHFKPLSEIERRLYALDQKINHRGPTIDVALATLTCELVKIEKANINARLYEITDGKVTAFTKLEDIKAFVSARGYAMSKANKQTVAAALAHDPDPVVREVLELRQAGANSAATKYDAVLKCLGPDQRIPGLLHIYGTISGRWTSARFNVHNMPREDDAEIAQAEIKAIQSGDLEQIRKFGPPLDVLAKAVRGLVIAPEGKVLLIGDFSMIEPRLISWYAGELWRLENFRKFDRTKDPRLDDYRVLGARMAGRSVDPKDKAARRRGKTAILSFGYGGSVATWRKHVPDDPRTDKEIKAHEVNRFREIYPAHTLFMFTLEQQALACVTSRQPVMGKRHHFTMDGNTLLLHLASGRALAYPNARLENGEYGKRVVAYDDPKGNTERLWYGALMAHLISGTARDLLVNALLKLDTAGFEITLHVHDEVVAEVDADKVDLDLFKKSMLDAPDWAKGLPLATEVRASERYIQVDEATSGDANHLQQEPTSTPIKSSATPTSTAPLDGTRLFDGVRPATAIPLPPKPAEKKPPASDGTEIDLADLIDLPVPTNRMVLCPFHSEVTPSLRIYTDHYFCFGCHAHGDHIDWLVQVEGMEYAEACDVLDNWDGPVVPRLQETENDAERTAYALTWWDSANPFEGTLAARYLADTRGTNLDALPANISEALRFHPSCVFGPGIRHPCLLALMRNPVSGQPTGIQRIALTSEAQKINRGMLGTAGVVQIWPASASLVIGEGLETTLAAATQLDYRGALLQPAWATLSDGGMERFPLIAGVERLILLVDNDSNRAGQNAADACKQRWLEAGRRGVLLMPNRPDTDFNDIVLEYLGRTP